MLAIKLLCELGADTNGNGGVTQEEACRLVATDPAYAGLTEEQREFLYELMTTGKTTYQQKKAELGL